MNILFLTDNFPPEVNAPASRTYEHCKVWIKQGHRITVITCFPNFPIGKVFNGYKNKLYQREVIDGINVIRVWSYIAFNKGFFKRIIDYMSYAFSATIALFFIKDLEGKWFPVVRYDTEHGFAHRDLLDKKGSKQKIPMFTKDYNEALTFAEYDIKSNWMIYKQAFLGGY